MERPHHDIARDTLAWFGRSTILHSTLIIETTLRSTATVMTTGPGSTKAPRGEGKHTRETETLQRKQIERNSIEDKNNSRSIESTCTTKNHTCFEMNEQLRIKSATAIYHMNHASACERQQKQSCRIKLKKQMDSLNNCRLISGQNPPGRHCNYITLEFLLKATR